MAINLRDQKSSQRIMSIFRKERKDQKPYVYRTENCIVELDNNQHEVNHTKMYKNNGKLGNLMISCIDKSEIEDLNKVYEKVKTHFNIQPEYLKSQKQEITEPQVNPHPEQSYLLNHAHGGKLTEIYLSLEREKHKKKRYNKEFKSFQKEQKKLEQMKTGAKQQKQSEEIELDLNTVDIDSNPYITEKEQSMSINKTIQNLKRNKHKFVKESGNRNYRYEFNKSFRFVKSVQAGKNPMIERHFQSYNSPTNNTLHNTMSVQDDFNRKTIISMVTGKPTEPYIKLQSLQDKLEKKGYERRKIIQNSKNYIFELTRLEEMDGFDYSKVSGLALADKQKINNLMTRKRNMTQDQAKNQELTQFQKIQLESAFVPKIQLPKSRRYQQNDQQGQGYMSAQLSPHKDLTGSKFQSSTHRYSKISKKDQEIQEKEKQKNFNRLLKKTQNNESLIVNSLVDYFQLKKNKNDDLNDLCLTAIRDRPATQEIRLQKYINPETQSTSKKNPREIKIEHLREEAENERKKRAEVNVEQVKWYDDLGKFQMKFEQIYSKQDFQYVQLKRRFINMSFHSKPNKMHS